MRIQEYELLKATVQTYEALNNEEQILEKALKTLDDLSEREIMLHFSGISTTVWLPKPVGDRLRDMIRVAIKSRCAEAAYDRESLTAPKTTDLHPKQ